MTTKDHKVTDVKLVSKMDPNFEANVKTEFQRVIEAQSPKVDVVSGATLSCKGLLKAVENALTR